MKRCAHVRLRKSVTRGRVGAVFGRRQDRANLRREFTENSRTTLIVVPLIAWFVLAPLLMAAALLAPGVMEQW